VGVSGLQAICRILKETLGALRQLQKPWPMGKMGRQSSVYKGTPPASVGSLTLHPAP
jgi:hypothetical protein